MPRKFIGSADASTAHYARIERYVALIDSIFNLSTSRVSSLVYGVEHDPSKLFRFASHPELKARLDVLMDALSSDVQAVIINGVTAEWEDSNFKNDKLAQSFLGGKSTEERFEKYFQNNNDALTQFIKRKDGGGLNLSTRVWNLTETYKKDLELALSIGLSDGRSADDLSRDIREYLREPKKLFRRVRNQYGDLVLSKAARRYSSGAGSYRSSYKNALRLARTEINMAYKTSDHVRWQQLDFVVGFEVKRSHRKYSCEICESFAGKYPKDFKFVGWHPNCRCFVIPILMTDDEFWSQSPTSVNEVKDVPESFRAWCREKIDRAKESQSVPYWVRDNFVKGRLENGLKRL